MLRYMQAIHAYMYLRNGEVFFLLLIASTQAPLMIQINAQICESGLKWFPKKKHWEDTKIACVSESFSF